MSPFFASAKSQVRVLELLARWARAWGVEMPQGVRVRVSASDLAREAGVDDSEVQALLQRLRRLNLATQPDSQSIVLADLPRLADFVRFVAEREADRESQPTRRAQSDFVEPLR